MRRARCFGHAACVSSRRRSNRDADTPEVDTLVADVDGLFARGEDAAAIALLDRQPARLAVAAFDRLQRRYYWKRRDVPRVVLISREGVRHAIAAADRSDDDAEAIALRSGAKTLAYNLGSFTWAGWDEPCITLTPEAIAAGKRAADLNLRLAEELAKPDHAKMDAWWLVGAHAMSADAFERGRGAIAVRTGDACRERMFDGYLKLVRALVEADDDGERLASAIDAMRATGDADDAEYARQLGTAYRVFAGRPLSRG